MRFFWLGIFVVSFVFSFTVFADTVDVRTGDHDDYTRLVLDGAGTLDYNIKTDEAGNLAITLPEGSKLQQGAEPGGNILNLDFLEGTKLVVDIPEKSHTRDFKIGGKLIIDIYNPPGGRKAQPIPKKPEKKQPVQGPSQEEKNAGEEGDVGEETVLPEDTESEEAAPERKNVQDVPAEKPEAVLQQDMTAEEKQAAMEAQLEELAENATLEIDASSNPLKQITSPNLVSFSSTQSFGMGTFISGDWIFIITDRFDEFIKPQVSGPNAQEIVPFKEFDVEQSRVYYAKLPGVVEKIRGEGSGLLWRVILGAQKEAGEPIEPQIDGVSSNDYRGGRVFFPMKAASKKLVVKHPITGEEIHVVTVKNAEEYVASDRHYIEFDILRSPIGLAVLPLVDDLQVNVTEEGVEITKPGGLVMMPDSLKLLAHSRKIAQEQRAKEIQSAPIKRIYKFKEWRLGGLEALHKNKTIMLASLKERDQAGQVEDLVSLGKMYLANARGSEALGFLRFASQELPAIQQTPEFLALRGASKAMAWKSEEAFRDLSHPLLDPFEETEYWRAYALADLGDWQQAADILPDNVAPIYDYPAAIRRRLGLVLAEITLRAGRAKEAVELLEVVEGAREGDLLLEPLTVQEEAALNYLRGEAARQQGKLMETVNYWQPLTRGADDLYRAKAGLALTRLLIEEGQLTHEEAIGHLERLRYTWRGDELEAQINYWLGQKYFQEGAYVKGLTIMRDAATYAPDTDMGRLITHEMAQVFTDLYMTEKLEEVTPLDAVAIYEQFSELVPTGAKGDVIVEKLAERLVHADLLQRAGNLLEHQIQHRISGEDAVRVGIRLAGIRILDREPEKAMEALNIATQEIRKLPTSNKRSAQITEMALLRARALSMQGRADQALALLEDIELTPDVNRLRTDIAWSAGYWDDASEALGDVITDEEISLLRPLSDHHTQLILNRAIALNLSSNRIGLANIREKYSDAMSQTSRARLFEVVTRPRQSPALADRQTLLSIVSEVDLFSGFLEGYRQKVPSDPSVSPDEDIAEEAAGLEE